MEASFSGLSFITRATAPRITSIPTACLPIKVSQGKVIHTTDGFHLSRRIWTFYCNLQNPSKPLLH